MYFQKKGDPDTTVNLPYLKRGNQIYIVQDNGKRVFPIERSEVEAIPNMMDKYREYNPFENR
jgi:hypothetical protein